MSGETKLSIIIPVYNAEKYLPDCLDSILAAGISNIEILLIDDGSKDRSAEVIRSYEERYPCIKGLFQENKGPSAARNLGLLQAAGEYICFFDSDDYVDPAAFAHRIQLLKEANADLWVSDYYKVADNKTLLQQTKQIPTDKGMWICDGCPEPFLQASDCFWNVWRYVFRRSFLLENDLCFCEGFHCAEDLEFMVRVLKAAKRWVLFHEPYYHYRIRYEDTLTRRYTLTRVEHTVEMLVRSSRNAGNGTCGKIVRERIGREYLLGLALLYEVPAEDRPGARKQLQKGIHLLRDTQGIYKLVGAVTRIWGIRLTAMLLVLAKRIQRLVRRWKSRKEEE